MKRLAVPSVILIAAAMLPGCDDGFQHGQFAVSGHASRTVNEMVGELMILRGDPLPLTAASDGSQPLMYILVIAPGVNSGLGSGTADETYLSALQWNFTTAQGPDSIKLKWDRRTDQVSASGMTFDRKQGIGFVLIREASGNVSVTQVAAINAGLDEFVALKQIQAAIPSMSAAKSVTLVR